MRARPAAGMLVALAVGITACAPAAAEGWTPAAWPAPLLQIIDAPPPPIDLAADPALAGALTPQRLRNDPVGIHARFSMLPGTDATASAFNAAIADTVRAAVAEQSTRRGVVYSPQPGAGLSERGCVSGSTLLPAAELLADPEAGAPGGDGTAVACDVVAAQGTFLGMRLRVVSGSAAEVTGDRTAIRYADTATGETVSAEALWAEGAAERLSALLVETLRREAGALSLRPADPGGEPQIAAITVALATTLPDADGVTVTLAPGFTSAELEALGVAATTAPMTVRIPREVAAPLLSGFGVRLMDAAAQPYAGPPRPGAGREWTDCTLLPCVALTYDDGPSGLTPPLLDILRDRHAAATFYVLGQYAAAAPDTIRRIVDDGHDLGNHTWSHPSLPAIDDGAVARQIASTDDAIRAITGNAPATFRPPYGEFNARVLAAAGKPAILWTVDTRDWAGPSDEEMRVSAVDGATPGGIILFHDTHERTIRVAPAVIDGLLDRGFSPVTLSQLFNGSLPTGGAWRAAP